jgi:hypothetical protein
MTVPFQSGCFSGGGHKSAMFDEQQDLQAFTEKHGHWQRPARGACHSLTF